MCVMQGMREAKECGWEYRSLKDVDAKTVFRPTFPSYDPERVINTLTNGTKKTVRRYVKEFPSHIAESDIAFKLAGSGGDGAQTAALLLTIASINEGFDATHIPSYGPESRGGTSYADVHVAKDIAVGHCHVSA